MVVYGQDRFSGTFFSEYKNCCQENFQMQVGSRWFLSVPSCVQLFITAKITKICVKINFMVVSLSFKSQKVQIA